MMSINDACNLYIVCHAPPPHRVPFGFARARKAQQRQAHVATSGKSTESVEIRTGLSCVCVEEARAGSWKSVVGSSPRMQIVAGPSCFVLCVCPFVLS